ncbi:tumor necrosis factor receptor superfamily member 3 [Microcaecilia unicolor]|uniref:Tumor necrosis factor receptor superfamily member 3-like n=1 Tax=Microcaecilia unicolor TaxID=1415580 RepID=A0A6P7X1H9_9AMPH|nr:tumor necrosis factor receptor superfamily member 3-like [Microcaecilia unicolor]
MTATQAFLLQGTWLLLAILWDFLPTAPAQLSPYKVKDQDECPNATKYYLKKNGLCCSRCPPGYFASETCIPGRDTTCLQCSNNMVTETWNYLPKCFLCPKCESVLGFEVALPCNLTHKTKCRCVKGTHCITADTQDECTHCESDSECPPGTEVSIPGNGISDTVCMPCRPGFYQNESSLESACQPHTKCTAGLEIHIPGSASSDSKCVPVPRKEPDYRLLLITISFLAALLFSIIIIICSQRRILHRKLKTLMDEKPQLVQETLTDPPSPNSPKNPLLQDNLKTLDPSTMHVPIQEEETLLRSTFPQRKVTQSEPQGYREAEHSKDLPETAPEEQRCVRDWQGQRVTAGSNSGLQMNGRSMTFNGNVYVYNGMDSKTPELLVCSPLSSPEPPMSMPRAGELRLVSPRQEDGKEMHMSVEEDYMGLTSFPI